MATSSTAVFRTAPKSVALRLRGGDRVAYLFTWFFAALILAVTLLVVYELWIHSSPAKEKFGLGFLGSKLWNPVQSTFRKAGW